MDVEFNCICVLLILDGNEVWMGTEEGGYISGND